MVRTKRVPEDSFWNTMNEVPADRSHSETPAADNVARQIQTLIVSRNLGAGERLPSERDLSEILATSRQTVSQAIRILVVKGLIESRRGSGTYVSRRPQQSLAATVNLMLDLDQDSVHQLNELRFWLETMGIVQAIERASDAEIADAELALTELQGSIGDTSAWMSADTQFHATLVRSAHNPYLTSVYEGVHTALIEYEYRAWVDRGTAPEWLGVNEAEAVSALHEPILRAVRERNVEAAHIAVQNHHHAMARHLAQSHRQAVAARADGATDDTSDRP